MLGHEAKSDLVLALEELAVLSSEIDVYVNNDCMIVQMLGSRSVRKALGARGRE